MTTVREFRILTAHAAIASVAADADNSWYLHRLNAIEIDLLAKAAVDALFTSDPLIDNAKV